MTISLVKIHVANGMPNKITNKYSCLIFSSVFYEGNQSHYKFYTQAGLTKNLLTFACLYLAARCKPVKLVKHLCLAGLFLMQVEWEF